MNGNNLTILLVVIPLIGSAICSIGKITSKTIICKISVVMVLLCKVYILLSVYPLLTDGKEIAFIVGGWEPRAGIAFGFDMLGWVISLLILVISFISLWFAFIEAKYSPNFYFTILILLAGMEGILLTRDLFNLFVLFEILAITSYILIAYFQKSHSILASFRYLIIGSAAMLIYLLGIFIIYQQTGSLSFTAIEQMRMDGNLLHLKFAIVAIFTGIGVRCAFIPFHTWLPEAHAYAPHPVSAILSGVMIKVSLISLWRILDASSLGRLNTVLLITGIITAFLGAIWALYENDVKKILAFSSISQVGYIVTAFSLGTVLSKTSSLYHITSHAISKSLLFLVIGCIIWSTGERNISKLSGLWKVKPLLGLLFTVAALSITGIFPFAGYVSKTLIVDSFVNAPVIFISLYIVSMVSFAAYLKLSSIFFDPFRNSKNETEKKIEIPFIVHFPLGFLGILCIVMGIFPRFWSDFFLSGISSEAAVEFPAIYSFKQIAKTIPIIIGGTVLFWGYSKKPSIHTTKQRIFLNSTLSNALSYILAGFVVTNFILWYN